MAFKPTPLPTGAYSDDSRPWTSQDVCNLIPVNAEAEGTRSPVILRMAPGLREFANVLGVTRQRGARNVEGRLFFVAGTSLCQMNVDGSVTDLGTIPGTSRVSMSHNQITNGNEVLIVTGTLGYIYNTVTATLTQITDAGFPGAKLAEYIGHLFVMIEPQGRYSFNSDLDDGLSYNALETFQGESKPDRIVSHIVANSEYVMLNERSMDHFAYTGVTNALFENKLIAIDRGCASTHATVLIDQAVCFIGDDGSGYAKRGYQLQRITTHAIEQAWKLCDLSKAYAFAWEAEGHKVWYVTMPDGLTWGYDFSTGKWHRRQSKGLNRWRLAWLVKWRGEYYGGEWNSGRVFRMEKGYPFEGCDEHAREFATGVLHSSGNRVTLDALRILTDSAGPDVPCESVEPLAFYRPLTAAGNLADMAVGDTVSYQYVTTGGTSPITFAITSGALPTGLSMSSSGLITGTATVALNAYSWTVTATDAEGNTATLPDTAYVLDLLGTPPNTTVNTAYSYTLTGTEGEPPYTFALTTGSLPPGLTLASSGLISGTTGATASNYPFAVTMTDSEGVDTVKPYSIAVAAAPAELYIETNADSAFDTYYVAETAGNTIVTTSPGIGYAYWPLVNAAKTRMYCSNATNVGYIDLATDTWTAFAGLACGEFVMDSTETYLYTVNFSAGRFQKVRISDGVVIDSVTGLGNVNAVCMSSDDALVYVIGSNAGWYTYNTVGLTMTVRADMAAGQGVCLNPANTRVYACAQDLIIGATNAVVVMTALTFAYVKTITIPADGRKIAFHPDSNSFAVACKSTSLNHVWIVNAATDAVTATITVGSGNHEIRYNAEGTRLYVSNDSSGTVSVVDVNTASANLNTVIATITPTDGVRGGIFVWPKA